MFTDSFKECRSNYVGEHILFLPWSLTEDNSIVQPSCKIPALQCGDRESCCTQHMHDAFILHQGQDVGYSYYTDKSP